MKKVSFKTILCLLGFLAFGFSCTSERKANDSPENPSEKQQLKEEGSCVASEKIQLTEVKANKLRVKDDFASMQAEKFIYENQDVFYLSASIDADINNDSDTQIIANIMWMARGATGNEIKRGLMSNSDPSDPTARIAFVDFKDSFKGDEVVFFSFRACVWEGFMPASEISATTEFKASDLGYEGVDLRLYCGEASENELQAVFEQGSQSKENTRSAYEAYKKYMSVFEENTTKAWQLIYDEVKKCASKTRSVENNSCGYSKDFFESLENISKLTPELYASFLSGPEGKSLKEASVFAAQEAESGSGAYSLASGSNDECISTKDLEDAEQKIAQKEKKSPPPVVSEGGSMKPSPSPDANKEDSSSKAELTVQKKWEFYEQRKRLCRGYASGQEPLNWPWDDSQTCKDAGYEWLAKTDGSDQSFCYDIAISCTAVKKASLEGLDEGSCGDKECTASEDESSCQRDCDKDLDKIHVAFDCNDDDPNNKRDKTTDADCDGILKGNEVGYDCDDTNSEKGAREASDMDCNGVADSTGDNSTGNWKVGAPLLAVGGTIGLLAAASFGADTLSARTFARRSSSQLNPGFDYSKATLKTDLTIEISLLTRPKFNASDVNSRIKIEDPPFKLSVENDALKVKKDGKLVGTWQSNGDFKFAQGASYDDITKVTENLTLLNDTSQRWTLDTWSFFLIDEEIEKAPFEGKVSFIENVNDPKLSRTQKFLQKFRTQGSFNKIVTRDIETFKISDLEGRISTAEAFRGEASVKSNVDTRFEMAGSKSRFFDFPSTKVKVGVAAIGVLVLGALTAGFVCGFSDACGALSQSADEIFAQKVVSATAGVDVFEAHDSAQSCLAIIQNGDNALEEDRKKCVF